MAESLLGRSLAMKEKLLGEYHPDVGSSLNLGAVAYGPDDRRTQDAVRYLTELFAAQGKTAQAATYQALVRRAARP